MTKEEVIQKIKSILEKDNGFKNVTLHIDFTDKKSKKPTKDNNYE